MTPLEEAVAREMAGDEWEATSFLDTMNGDDPEDARGYWLLKARAALAVVRRELREPKPEMLGAWYRYKSGFRFRDEPPATDTSDYGAYRAMLAASPLGEASE